MANVIAQLQGASQHWHSDSIATESFVPFMSLGNATYTTGDNAFIGNGGIVSPFSNCSKEKQTHF